MAGFPKPSQPLPRDSATAAEPAPADLATLTALLDALQSPPATHETAITRALAVLMRCFEAPAGFVRAGDGTLLAIAGVEPEALAMAAPGADAELELLALGHALAPDPSHRHGFGALLRVPLSRRDGARGQLGLLLDRPRPLTPRQRELLSLCGRLLDLTLAQRAVPEAETLRISEERYRQLSVTDELTGLYNSRHFHPTLEAEVERARRFGDPLSLLLLDIDDFKAFNGRYGRAAGDQVLARLGKILRASLRKIDTAFRYGGEEIAVVLPRCGTGALHRLAERIRIGFAAESFDVGKAESARLSISIGATPYPRGAPIEAFIRRADRALYQAKAGGKNRVMVAAPLVGR